MLLLKLLRPMLLVTNNYTQRFKHVLLKGMDLTKEVNQIETSLRYPG